MAKPAPPELRPQDQARVDGHDAFLMGLQYEDCPYECETLKAIWEIAFLEVEHEREMAKRREIARVKKEMAGSNGNGHAEELLEGAHGHR